MANVSSSILGDANIINLREIPISDARSEVLDFLVRGEQIIKCFHTIRDQVIFTNKRVFVVNVQGLVGKKISFFSYPYSKVQYFGIQTAGVLDLDSELVLAFNDGNRLQFDFSSQVDTYTIARVAQAIAESDSIALPDGAIGSTEPDMKNYKDIGGLCSANIETKAYVAAVPAEADSVDETAKEAHFEVRPAERLRCPVCGKEQSSKRSACQNCGVKFIFDNETAEA